MKNPPLQEFQYVKIENGRRLFCLQQNLVVLAWILFFKKDTLRPAMNPDLRALSIKEVSSRLLSHYRRMKKILILLLVFARQKYSGRISESAVILPVFGHICVPVHKGYKIFDLRRETVAKVFDHDIEESSISSEIEGLKNVAPLHFAPSIKRWNLAERWYEEDYVNGSLNDPKPPLDSARLFEHFVSELMHPLNSLILFQKPSMKNAVEYVNGMLEKFNAGRLPGQKLPEKEFKTIKSFLNSLVERLRGEGNLPVYLVFTHGDFCPANMLNTRHGIKIIDWEGAGYRSALFDFYSYFFYRPVCRNVPVKTVAFEIKEALPIFLSRLAERSPEISRSLMQLEDSYRWMYYIEQVCQEVEREMTDTNLDILDFIIRYIQAFSHYEEMCGVTTEIGR